MTLPPFGVQLCSLVIVYHPEYPKGKRLRQRQHNQCRYRLLFGENARHYQR